jgi:hypothetical protein
MKLGWLLMNLYIVRLGAVLYVLSCQEPAPGEHAMTFWTWRRLAAPWRKTWGENMGPSAFGSFLFSWARIATGLRHQMVRLGAGSRLVRVPGSGSWSDRPTVAEWPFAARPAGSSGSATFRLGNAPAIRPIRATMIRRDGQSQATTARAKRGS